MSPPVAPETVSPMVQPDIEEIPARRPHELREDRVCYHEGCKNLADFTCHYPLCSKNYGCGKRMCSEHKVKYSYMKDKHDPDPDVCLECGPGSIKASRIAFWIPLTIFLLTVILLGYVEFVALAKDIDELQ